MTFVDDLNMDYEYANRLFFGGKLPTLPVRVKKLPGTVVGRTRYQNKVGSKKRLVPVEVVISPRLNRPWLGSTSRTVLLHEMAHVKLGVRVDCEVRDGAFDAEMLRLSNAGAFQGLW